MHSKVLILKSRSTIKAVLAVYFPVVSFTGSQMMTFANQLLLKPVSYFFVIRPNFTANEYAITGSSAYGMGISINPAGYISPVQQNYNFILLNSPLRFQHDSQC